MKLPTKPRKTRVAGKMVQVARFHISRADEELAMGAIREVLMDRRPMAKLQGAKLILELRKAQEAERLKAREIDEPKKIDWPTEITVNLVRPE